ncbi:MAG: toxin HicA [Chloroflexi bacterium]|nr:toxin HicA [Chloroflexota bacterium]
MAGSIEKIIRQMQGNPQSVGFSDLCKVCRYYFGKPRQEASSHHIYKTPWQGDPRINIQNDKGKAKAYQVGQVLKAIDKLGAQNGNKTN